MKKQRNCLLVAIIAAAFVSPAVSAVTSTDKKTVTSKAYVDTKLLEKQDTIAGRNSGSSYAMTYPATTGGQPTARAISTSLADDTNLATRGAINNAINTKQDKITGGTANTVVLYNSAGGVTNASKPVYSESGEYNSTTSQNLTQVNHVNEAVTRGFNAHLTCVDYDPRHVGDPDFCYSYRVNELSDVYVPHR